MKRISLEELLKSHLEDSYENQYHYIMDLLKQGRIKPVKAAGTNGKKPALYRFYWILEQKKDYSTLEEELKYHLHPMISVDYYLSHLENYEKDRPFVIRLDKYLRNNQEKLSYYSHTRITPQNLLILENKDTFYSMRRHLLNGNKQIFGRDMGTLIYGVGKRILKSFEDFEFCVEPYRTDSGNTIYYFGDLDYEGIGIYENLAKNFQMDWKIQPFVSAYQAMLSKAEHVEKLPDTKEKQNRNISDF